MRASSLLVLSFIASASLLPGCKGDLAPLEFVSEKTATRDLADKTGYGADHQKKASAPTKRQAAEIALVDAIAAPPQPAPTEADAETPDVTQDVSASASVGSCDPSVIKALLTPIASDPSPVRLTCRATLPQGVVVTRQVLFEGAASSGAALDCSGSTLTGTEKGGDREPLVIRSKKTENGWSRPVGVTVNNCVVDGGVRIIGLGRTGESKYVKLSSMNANHTAFAQASAPQATSLRNLKIRVRGRIALYAGPGSTETSLVKSVIEGTTPGVAIYLDAESAGANIVGNRFDIETKKRELIAIDGSAHNVIKNNRFNTAGNGGIFVYRNCGEGGAIRHQAPQFNQIENNTFNMEGSDQPAVWLNSRNGNRNYCFHDPNHPFGSSLSSMDMAKNNIVENNRIFGERGDGVRNSDPSNIVSNND